MYKKTGYPRLVVDTEKVRHNVRELRKLCGDMDIDMMGVIKGFHGHLPIVQAYVDGGIKIIGSSRLEQLANVREAGIEAELMMLRVPTLSDIPEIVRICDISLNSEVETLKSLNIQAGIQRKIHKVVIMCDVGDLREGFWDEDELIATAVMVENEMPNLKLLGIATNIGCYGSVMATDENMNKMVRLGRKVEELIGRKLDIISGGATSSLLKVLDKTMPEGINFLRVGEGILTPGGVVEMYGCDFSFLNWDIFTVQAEVIEIKTKPSHPVGELGFDAFGNKVTYEDRGIRKRALLAIGKADYVDCGDLFPADKGIFIVGASGDHTIIDIEDAERDYKLGDILEFGVNYQSMLYLTNSNNVEKVFI